MRKKACSQNTAAVLEAEELLEALEKPAAGVAPWAECCKRTRPTKTTTGESRTPLSRRTAAVGALERHARQGKPVEVAK